MLPGADKTQPVKADVVKKQAIKRAFSLTALPGEMRKETKNFVKIQHTMSDNNPHKKVTWHDVQQSADDLILEVGLAKAHRMIRGLSRNSNIIRKTEGRYELIKDYIIGEAILIFKLDKKHFFNANFREYRQARMACYRILSQYAKDTHSQIATAFGRKRGSVFYYIHKCEEVLSLPKYYKDFVEKYKTLEARTLHFISNLK